MNKDFKKALKEYKQKIKDSGKEVPEGLIMTYANGEVTGVEPTVSTKSTGTGGGSTEFP